MTNERRGLWVACAWAMAALLLTCTTGNAAARLVLCAPLALYLPGYAILKALRAARRTQAEWQAFAVALSLAVVILGGFVLNTLNALTPQGWACWLTIITAAACGTAMRQGPSAPQTPIVSVRSTFSLAHYALFGVAAAIAGGAYGFAAQDVASFHEFHYTEFWMLPPDTLHVGAVSVGTRNDEGRPMDYDIELALDGQILASWQLVAVQSGETVVRNAAINAEHGKVAARLYKSGDRGSVYREVSAYLGADGAP
jgi:uncharacterized membrane protein